MTLKVEGLAKEEVQFASLHTLCLTFPENIVMSGSKANFTGRELKIQPEGWSWAESGTYSRGRFCIRVDQANFTVEEGVLYGITTFVIVPTEAKWPTVNVWLVDFCNYDCSRPDVLNAGNDCKRLCAQIL